MHKQIATSSLTWPWLTEKQVMCYNSNINWPKISIVTPSLNQGQYLEAAILSILNQNYPNLEYIIIDGASTDNSVDIIKKYEHKLTYWSSEKDTGQSHAINKGLEKCHGVIFNWINSDDMLAENALYNIATAYLKKPNVKIVAGGCAHIKFSINEEYTYNKQDLTFNGLITEKSNFQQPSQWISLARNRIRLNEHLHYSFDWEMVLKLDAKDDEVTYIDKLTSYFREHPESKTSNHSFDFQIEKLIIIKNYIDQNKKMRWTLFKYKLLLEAYLYTYQSQKKHQRLLPILIKKPLFVFSRFYISHLMRELFRRMAGIKRCCWPAEPSSKR